MSYTRVLPRDLFNEADLLKLIGRLWISVDEGAAPNCQFITEEIDGPFLIEQDQSDGSISAVNIAFEIRGKLYRLFRPLNSRSLYALYVIEVSNPDAEAVQVFRSVTKHDFTYDFRKLFHGSHPEFTTHWVNPWQDDVVNVPVDRLREVVPDLYVDLSATPVVDAYVFRKAHGGIRSVGVRYGDRPEQYISPYSPETAPLANLVAEFDQQGRN